MTGAGGALGGAVVRRLSADGWHGVASVRRAPAAMPEGWRAEVGDLARADEAERVAQAALAAHGRLDLAVLAAGGWEGGSGVDGADAGLFERMLRLNAETAWHCARAAARAMASRPPAGPRTIVLVSAFSAIARPAPPGQGAYRAAKAATAALAEALATDLADEGIAVFALAPTTLRTDANRRAMPDGDPSRWVGLDDAAEVVAFLATAAARPLSGAVLPLDARVRS